MSKISDTVSKRLATARGRSVRLKEALEEALEEEWRILENADRDRAHYATIVDHPYQGSHPCAPESDLDIAADNEDQPDSAS